MSSLHLCRIKIIFVLLTVFVAPGLIAQHKKTIPTDTTTKSGPVPPSVSAPTPKTGPKPYKEVITAKAQSRKGVFSVHKVDDKWFFELGDSLLGKDILIVNRIAKAPINTRSGFFGYAGDEIN